MYSTEQIYEPEFWTSYPSEDYSLAVPAHWERLEPPMPIIKEQFINDVENEDFFIMVQTTIEDIPPIIKDVDQYIDIAQSNWPKLLQGFELLENKWITDEHIPYYYAEYISEIEGDDIVTRNYIWFMGRKAIHLTITVDVETAQDENYFKFANLLSDLFKIKINFA